MSLGEIIADEIKIRATRPDTTYPFRCLITKLCEAAFVPIITGLDKEVHAKKTHNPNRFDESEPMLVTEKGADIESGTIRSEGVQTPATTAGSTQNVQVSAPESAQATSFVGDAPIPEREENTVVAAPVSEYALTPQNFKKLVKQGKKFEAQLRLFANQFKSAVDKKIKKAMAPFLTLHGRIDEMEHRVNERLKEMSVPDLASFDVALKKAKADITALQSHQLVILSEPTEEEPLFDITRKPVDKKDKGKRKRSDSDEQRRLEKRAKKQKDKKKMKKAWKKSKAEGEPLEELLRARAVGASTSGPPGLLGSSLLHQPL